MNKEEILNLKAKIKRLSHHHPNDDDPTGEFYTVKEQRRHLKQKLTIAKKKNQ